jgi:hypothetical protein
VGNYLRERGGSSGINITMNIEEIGHESVNWILLVQDKDHLSALVSVFMN